MQHTGSVFVALRLSCTPPVEFYPIRDPTRFPCLGRLDSHPLYHQGSPLAPFFFFNRLTSLRAKVILLEYLESLNTFLGKEEKGKMSDAVYFGLFSLLAFKALRISSLLIFKMRLFGQMTPRLSALNT